MIAADFCVAGLGCFYVSHIDPDNLPFLAGAEVAAVGFHAATVSIIDWHTRQFLPARPAAHAAILAETSAFASASFVAETLKHFTRVDLTQQVLQVKGAETLSLEFMPDTLKVF
jgi:hypothetical protein